MKIIFIKIFNLRKSSAFILLLLNLTGVSARANGIQDTLISEKTLWERLTGLLKTDRLPQVHLNTRTAFYAETSGNASEKSAFRMDYVRMQIEGKVNDWIYYKWLQHLNRSNQTGSLDNMPASTDCLGVGFYITPTLSSFVGRQPADFGGFEYDADPAQVYFFSELGNHLTCFMTGVHLAWQCTPTQELRFQIMDARSNRAETVYGKQPDTFIAAKVPLEYTLNWNGQFLSSRLLTRCSFSLSHEGTNENVYFLALGAAWMQSRFDMYVDAMYSAEDIDKLGILSEMTAEQDEPVRFRHGGYLSLVSRMNFRPSPKLNLFVKGTYETASVLKANGPQEKGKYRTSYGYQGGIEYLPMKDNLRFFILYQGRQIQYTRYTAPFHLSNENPQQFSMGVVYKIPLF